MYKTLEKDKRNINKFVNEFCEFATEYLESCDKRNIGIVQPKFECNKLEQHGLGFSKTLELFAKKYEPYLSGSASSRYFGFVTGGATPASLIGDWVTSLYDQNVATLDESCSPEITYETIQKLKTFFELDDSFEGIFTSGATMSNFVGLATARQWFGKFYGKDISIEGLQNIDKKLNIYSATPHSSIYKSLSMLGLGKNSLKLVKTKKDAEAIDLPALEFALSKQGISPCIVVANAGTVNSVGFDDIKAISRLKKKYNFWLHVDAAFGGFAKCSPKYKHLAEGLENADSITIDAHKWLNVPYDSAMLFTKHLKLQFEVFQNSAAYLNPDFSTKNYVHLTPQNSQRLRALPVWFTLNAYGQEGYREIVERDCEMAKMIAEKIQNSSDFVLLSDVILNGVCFTLNRHNITTETINKYISKLKENGKIFITSTVYKNTPALRISVTNWQTNRRDIQITWKALNEAL